MHENLGTNDRDDDPRINLDEEIRRGVQIPVAPREPLESAFPVRAEMVRGPKRALAVSPVLHKNLLRRFGSIQEALAQNGVSWEPLTLNTARIGHIAVGSRQQAFTIFLHTNAGVANLRCVSPVGQIDVRARTEAISRVARTLPVRIGAVFDPRFQQYDLTAEADVLLGSAAADEQRALWLIRSTANSADQLEKTLLDEIDADVADFRKDLDQEPHFER